MKQAVRNTRQQGLTLLELMVVLAIIGILAMVGATQFQNYIARSRVAAGLSLAAPYKLAIEEKISTGHDTFKPNDLGLPAFVPAQDVKDIRVSEMSARSNGGVITITFGERLDNKTLTLTPLVSDSGIQWLCAAADVKQAREADAKAVGNDAFQAGTLEQKFAPADCRA